MAEQHVFNQVLGQGRAVQGHERAFGAVGGFVQHPGQNFFTGTGGANQQGRDFGLRHALGQANRCWLIGSTNT